MFDLGPLELLILFLTPAAGCSQPATSRSRCAATPVTRRSPR